jgi:hypothetical protein
LFRAKSRRFEMKMIANRPEGKLVIGDTAFFPISNTVRTLKHGTRRSSEVVRTIPDNMPYDPMPFPAGVWQITGVEWQRALILTLTAP